ncbi:MAG TPA: hypothetical protein VFG68_10735 [Fimbriiglobus sp.]|nr:hypothetical protein [Fimbriiglobus sp.]
MLAFTGLLTAFAAAQAPAPLQETTVGMPGRLENVVLPGPELEPTPRTDRKRPVVVQSLTAYPHGTAFRYDIEYYGLDPGTYNLADYLRRKDGTPAAGLPPLTVTVNPVRPPGQVEPNELTIDDGPRVGGYRLMLLVGGVVWGLGLLAIVGWMLWPLFRSEKRVAYGRPVSLADRLRPLVEGAIAGKLSQPELAGLERTLLAYWRKRLNLEAVEPAEAMRQMRQHPDAGPLLGQLETWLHKPGPHEPVDVAALLRPYRDLPPDAADLPPLVPSPLGRERSPIVPSPLGGEG